VFEEFVRWFSAEDAGAPERYREVSSHTFGTPGAASRRSAPSNKRGFERAKPSSMPLFKEPGGSSWALMGMGNASEPRLVKRARRAALSALVPPSLGARGFGACGRSLRRGRGGGFAVARQGRDSPRARRVGVRRFSGGHASSRAAVRGASLA
jgi:hypothetical protein